MIKIRKNKPKKVKREKYEDEFQKPAYNYIIVLNHCILGFLNFLCQPIEDLGRQL
jgi:hypothetical protein